MSRNNQERLGATKAQGSPAAFDNSTFQFVVPTEFVELPSKGRFYPPNHPLHNVAEIEIKYMTAKEEDILANETYIRKGVVIDKLIQSVLINKSIKPDDLLIGDKNAIMIAARITGFGADYETKVDCPSCETKVDFSFDLSTFTIKNGGIPENSDAYENVTENNDGTFNIVLPTSKFTVTIKTLTGADEIKLLTNFRNKKKSKLPQTTLTDQLRIFIVAVNGNTNTSIISQFVDVLPAFDSRYLRLVYSILAPNIELKQTFTCNNCDFESELEVPFSTEFFWPKQ